MSPKILPIKGHNSKGGKTTPANEIVVDHGSLGKGVEYEIYKRGVIHVFNKDLCFKKDIDQFEDCLDKMTFEKLGEGESLTMEGSGDNDHLVFTVKDGELQVSLSKRGFAVINKLKSILNRGRNLKEIV